MTQKIGAALLSCAEKIWATADTLRGAGIKASEWPAYLMPFFALMMLHRLGPGYIVWDQAGSIRYRLPGHGTVRAHFALTRKEVDAVRRATRHGDSCHPVFRVDIVDSDGNVVAEVESWLRSKIAARDKAQSNNSGDAQQ